ncbi:MAG: YggS family pyridoxal phosphate enzyme [Candidatus Lindowbacteria bacterium RIFCSPLOWO2_12_FULL_62_27]|nr:MAG: YggS family pyridoxal phosphate enzyme [Candidatus Lindowbacteria bacterium RIFCSPLOWO2_12_FULL_62_27]
MRNSTDIGENIKRLRERIRAAAARAGRPPDGIACIAVAKGHPPAAVRVAVREGLAEIAENRVQEAVPKAAQLADLSIRWHLVGSLQTNKVRPAVRLFSMIQSLDRIDLARAIQKECEKENRTIDALVQIEPTGEPAKHGVPPEAAAAFVRSLAEFDRIRLRGLMAIGPLTEDREKIRACFRQVRELFQSIRPTQEGGAVWDTLSMGMSDDFEIAIEEGATLLRIGTLIFGPRSPSP